MNFFKNRGRALKRLTMYLMRIIQALRSSNTKRITCSHLFFFNDYKESEKQKKKTSNSKCYPFVVVIILDATLVTRNERNLNLSHIDGGFHIISKPKEISDDVVCSVIIRTWFQDFHPNRIECFCIILAKTPF